MSHYHTLEFNTILEQLSGFAYTQAAKARCISLAPCLAEREAKRRLEETTQAKRIMEQAGSPPLTAMADIEKLITLVDAGDMLLPGQLEQIAMFITTCKRLKQYLKRAESTGSEIASYGNSISELAELLGEIERCIRNSSVDDHASNGLGGIRRQIGITAEQIKSRLSTMLSKNKSWFSESFVSMRGGHFTLPVKREYKNSVPGTVIEMSNTGGTCFVEPSSVAKLQQEMSALEIAEDNEIRKILYILTGLVGEYLREIRLNIEAMETLDFLFAKAKLSIGMKASPVNLITDRSIRIVGARHPLLDEESAVPLHFELGGKTRGVVITGPNTGGKTVALKTVGLLSLMAQSGLHVPADEDSVFSMHNLVLCDIGDGQSISENLSTFSSHMKNVIGILKTASAQSLVLLDELGSGTDPAEGMGLAVAILEELCRRDCLFVATTHYPEVKEYAARREGLINARMAFDRQSLMPLYSLELGEAGESCALYIAERLGMPEHILKNAGSAAYGAQSSSKTRSVYLNAPDELKEKLNNTSAPRVIPDMPPRPVSTRAERFHLGDSVIIYPQKAIGIVCAEANEHGEVGVLVKKEKKLILHKRLKLQVAASELYPANYDFSIVFDTVSDRKARQLMNKRHEEGNIVVIDSN